MFRPLTGRVSHGDEDEPKSFSNPCVLVAVIAQSRDRCEAAMSSDSQHQQPQALTVTTSHQTGVTHAFA
jgi:hypothetical protein